jgi:adenylylsulfate kinase
MTILHSKKVVFWLTGLSGAGKTTLAQTLHSYFKIMHVPSYVIDGDEIRKSICADLSFSESARSENARRVSHLCNMFLDSHIVPIVSLITPKAEDRYKAKEIIKGVFVEVYVECPIETCAERDPKGLYKRVTNGEILNFTGISAEYEIPQNPSLTLHTKDAKIGDCVEQLLEYWKTL